MMFSFEMSEKRRLIRVMAARFAQIEILPVRDQFEADYAQGKVVDTVLMEAAKVGLLGFPIEEKYGGSNANNLDTMVVLEELAALDGGMATVIGDTWFAMTPIIMAANDEQRERFLRPLASRTEVNLGAICMTYPPSGADIEDPRMGLRTCKTIIKEDGNDLISNGAKICSNAGIAYCYVIVGTVDPNRGEAGSCLVVVEKDRPGLSFGKPEPKMGMHADRNSEVVLEEVRVPEGLNQAEGFGPEADKPPEIWFETMVGEKGEPLVLRDYFGHSALGRNDVEQFVQGYYDERGWKGGLVERKLT